MERPARSQARLSSRRRNAWSYLWPNSQCRPQRFNRLLPWNRRRRLLLRSTRPKNLQPNRLCRSLRCPSRLRCRSRNRSRLSCRRRPMLHPYLRALRVCLPRRHLLRRKFCRVRPGSLPRRRTAVLAGCGLSRPRREEIRTPPKAYRSPCCVKPLRPRLPRPQARRARRKSANVSHLVSGADRRGEGDKPELPRYAPAMPLRFVCPLLSLAP